MCCNFKKFSVELLLWEKFANGCGWEQEVPGTVLTG
jgi:hypothetical protein